MKTRYLMILTALAFLGFSVSAAAHPCDRHDDKSHKHCDNEPGGGDGSIVYTAKLSGAFVFNENVTPNKRKSSLHSNQDLDLERSGYPTACSDISIEDEETYKACQTWNHVFNTCLLLLVGGEDSVDLIRVGDDDWSIQKPGGVYVQFGDMPVPGAKVSVNLYGNKELNVDPFLPTLEESPSLFILDGFATWGKPLPGEDGAMSLGCEPFENRPLGYWDAGVFIETSVTLEITAELEE